MQPASQPASQPSLKPLVGTQIIKQHFWEEAIRQSRQCLSSPLSRPSSQWKPRDRRGKWLEMFAVSRNRVEPPPPSPLLLSLLAIQNIEILHFSVSPDLLPRGKISIGEMREALCLSDCLPRSKNHKISLPSFCLSFYEESEVFSMREKVPGI